MLRSIVEGKESSQLILVEDTIEINGRCLIKAFISSLVKRLDHIHVFLTEVHPTHYLRGFPPEVNQRITVHNLTTDPLGWNNESEHSPIPLSTDFVQHLLKHKEDTQGTISIIIDCLSTLMLEKTTPEVCRILYSLCNIPNVNVHQVIALVHRDLHEDTNLGLLHHTATTQMTLEPSNEKQCNACCNMLHKKLSGKVIKIRENFSQRNNWDIDIVQEVLTLGALGSQEQVTDPAANLTFKLSLNESEKAARKDLVLPFTYNQNRKEETLAKSVGEGKIFYQPDEVDDFDEEDPDDDLDI